MSLAEILARKKAAAAAANSPSPAPTEAPAPAPAPAAEEKPLTFAEKLALRRKQEAEARAKTEAPPPPAANPLAILEEPQEAEVKAPKEQREVKILTEDAEAQQQYANLREKIDALEDRAGEDLKNSMTILKKALMENPAACELMLDEDIGEMVKALRRITMQDVIEVKESGSGRKKPKASTMAPMTPEMFAKGLAEL